LENTRLVPVSRWCLTLLWLLGIACDGTPTPPPAAPISGAIA
jgi:hypothetical protein